MDADSQTLQLPPWLSFEVENKVCTQAIKRQVFMIEVRKQNYQSLPRIMNVDVHIDVRNNCKLV